MFILHKGNNCTQRSLLNLDKQANYVALLFLPIAFSAATKLHTKTWAFPQGMGFIYSNLCTIEARLKEAGLQVALQFPQGHAWGIFVTFALSLQVCSPANHSTSPQPAQHLTTGCQLTTAKTDPVETISAADCLMTELCSFPCLHCPAATLPNDLSTMSSAALPVPSLHSC